MFLITLVSSSIGHKQSLCLPGDLLSFEDTRIILTQSIGLVVSVGRSDAFLLLLCNQPIITQK